MKRMRQGRSWRGRRLFEELPALANDDEMDEERARGPDARGQGAGPQTGKQPDGDDQKQDDRRGRNAVLRELPQQLVIENRPRAAGRGQPVACFAHMLGRQPPLRRRGGGRRSKIARFARHMGHCGPRLAGIRNKSGSNSLRRGLSRRGACKFSFTVGCRPVRRPAGHPWSTGAGRDKLVRSRG